MVYQHDMKVSSSSQPFNHDHCSNLVTLMGDHTTDQVLRVPKQVSHLMWLGNEQTTNIKSSEPSWRNSQDAKTSFTAVAMVATAARSTTMKVPTDVPEERWQW